MHRTVIRQVMSTSHVYNALAYFARCTPLAISEVRQCSLRHVMDALRDTFEAGTSNIPANEIPQPFLCDVVSSLDMDAWTYPLVMRLMGTRAIFKDRTDDLQRMSCAVPSLGHPPIDVCHGMTRDDITFSLHCIRFLQLSGRRVAYTTLEYLIQQAEEADPRESQAAAADEVDVLVARQVIPTEDEVELVVAMDDVVRQLPEVPATSVAECCYVGSKKGASVEGEDAEFVQQILAALEGPDGETAYATYEEALVAGLFAAEQGDAALPLEQGDSAGVAGKKRAGSDGGGENIKRRRGATGLVPCAENL